MKRSTCICAAASLLASALLVSTALADEGKLIPRSIPGDKGKYYLLESRRTGDVVKALHKRIGVDDTVWTRTETNCKTMHMREIGNSDESAIAIKPNPTKWFELVPGSSKGDLARLLCDK